MPQSKSIENAVKHLARCLAVYNRRKWGYFNPHVPLRQQRWYPTFEVVASKLQERGMTPEELLSKELYQNGLFYPSFLSSKRVQQAIERFSRVQDLKEQVVSEKRTPLQSDQAFICDLAESTGKNPIFLINFFWNDLQEETRGVFKSLHNDFFLQEAL
jgi:hypothetical protein